MMDEVKDLCELHKIDKITFHVLGCDEIDKLSCVVVDKKAMYDAGTRKPSANGPLDLRLGVSTKSGICETCGEGIQGCAGHFGKIKLVLPVYHIGFLKNIIGILNCVCKKCGNFLLTLNKKFQLGRKFSSGNNFDFDLVREECKKVRRCWNCGNVNGIVKKSSGFRIYCDTGTKNINDSDIINTNDRLIKNKKANMNTGISNNNFGHLSNQKMAGVKHIGAIEEINPLTCLNIFKMIHPKDYYYLGLKYPPMNFIIENMIVPPACIRPSVDMSEEGFNEDDLTVKLSEIVHTNNLLEENIRKGNVSGSVNEAWEMLQLQVNLFINSDLPGIIMPYTPIRGIVQRLKGKQGRFRCNLSGKRVDFSGRTVISPDPNLSVEEVGIPEDIAKVLTVPERVTRFNIEWLKKLVSNRTEYPGANYVVQHGKDGREFKRFLMYGKIPELDVGDIVERHLLEGDIVLFNRQPSLHRMSILGHRVKIHKHKTFRFNECNCASYNADFDGDEMNIHVPQTIMARIEARAIMGVRNNICTARNGEPLISCTQDFLTGSYLMTSKNTFFTRERFGQFCGYALHGFPYIIRQKPVIVSPVELFTGKQVFEVIINTSLSNKVDKQNGLTNCNSNINNQNGFINANANNFKFKNSYNNNNFGINMTYNSDLINHNSGFINLNAHNRTYGQKDDGEILIRNNKYIKGRIDKSIIGGENKKGSLIYQLINESPDCAIAAMNSISRVSVRYLAERGFSIGLDDVFPSDELNIEKNKIITQGFMEVDRLVNSVNKGCENDGIINNKTDDFNSEDSRNNNYDNKKDNVTVKDRKKTIDEEKEVTVEMEISKILSKIREDCGNVCIRNLSRNNAPVIMQDCGSKGSKINVSQMIACVSQQIISGHRIPEGMGMKTLPHFPNNCLSPKSRGFISNSFFSGLRSYEFFFHAVSGREGLVDTAVKTAETGYMQRRLMKALEDLSVKYDHTVRNSYSDLIQYNYGEDNMDPLYNEEEHFFDWKFKKAISHFHLYVRNDPKIITDAIISEAFDFHKFLFGIFNNNCEIKENILNIFSDNNAVNTLNRWFVDEKKDMKIYQAYYSAFVNTWNRFYNMIKNDNLKKFMLGENFINNFIEFSKDKIVSYFYHNGKFYFYLQNIEFLNLFLNLISNSISEKVVSPCTAVGAIAGQSIGEPGTQMTLKTFHFAGVASMNITLGIPRLKEIINSAVNIATPIIKAKLLNPTLESARVVKARIEKIYFKDICKKIIETITKDYLVVNFEIDMAHVYAMRLDITPNYVLNILTKEFKNLNFDVKGDVISYNCKRVKRDTLFQKERIKKQVLDTQVSGISTVNRVIINENTDRQYELLIEGTGLQQIFGTPGIEFSTLTFNNIREAYNVLGIEAARTLIINEINYTMSGHGIKIDPRHLMLLSDMMCFKGEVLGITRFGIGKMRASALMLASFEQTADYLFGAAAVGKEEKIVGVSESIIMGVPIDIGTGSIELLWKKNKIN